MNLMKKLNNLLLFSLLNLFLVQVAKADHSVARKWNDVLLDAIRSDYARPTVHARNLFHVSFAMYDSWAVYDTIAEPYLLGRTKNGYTCSFNGFEPESFTNQNVNKTICYAVYTLIKHRFADSPGKAIVYTECDNLMDELGFDKSFSSTDYSTGNPAALGNYIAECIIQYGLEDYSNEQNAYENQYYKSINKPLLPKFPGNPDCRYPNRWQPLALETFVDQSGNVLPKATPDFLSPEWGKVHPFSLTTEDLTIHERDGETYYVYHDPGVPPYLTNNQNDASSKAYHFGFELVAIWSSHLDPSDNVMIDISPASMGNIQEYPENYSEYENFYDLENGGGPGEGYDVNPKTGLPYEPQLVPRGDFTRVLAEFWADGPDSETPPGHWFTILNYVNDHPQFEKKFKGEGAVLDSLEWDVKAYFSLGGAMHDAAISAWGIKGWYDYIRPISAIRYMCDKGQCSDPSKDNYSSEGVTLREGYIEIVEEGDILAGSNNEHVGKIKLYAWRGPNYINNPDLDEAGVGWILAENWWPYQRPSFVTPPFAGFVSGHSVYSRSAAELMTLLTGDPYFPGGMSDFKAEKNDFLVFEEGPSVDVVLQWATYRDASDQTSLSRIWGGIHPPADDILGRFIGMEIGVEAFEYAEAFFTGNVVETAISEFEKEDQLLYPNPAKDVVNIDLPDQNILVQSSVGQYYSFSLKNGQVNISELPAGIYFLQSEKGIYKFMKN